MPDLTIRNISKEVLDKIRTLSNIEKRSLNSEILILIENGLKNKVQDLQKTGHTLSSETQISIWKDLAGSSENTKETEQIVKDIYAQRSKGRHVSL